MDLSKIKRIKMSYQDEFLEDIEDLELEESEED